MLAKEKETTFPTGEFETREAVPEDLQHVVELINICSADSMGKPMTDIERTGIDWATPGFELGRSARVVHSQEGRLVGFAAVWDLASVPVSPSVTGCVHPAFESNGIGTWLLAWAERRARQTISRVPEDALVTMMAGTVSTHKPSNRLFQSRDMRLSRHFWDMLITLNGQIPVPQWPQSVKLKTFAELPDLERVLRAVDEAFQDHWGHVDQPIDKLLDRWQHHIENDQTFDPSLWFLAMDGDEIAGVSLCDYHTPEDALMGWVDVLGVRRPWRRRGLALALLHHSFSELRRRGRARVGLGVDSASLTGATRLYERAGMHVLRQFDVYEKTLRPGHDLRTKGMN